jgi:zinc transport system substrate-binding protein
VIFYQAEIDSQQTKAFAESIGGRAERVSPPSGDYINTLAKTATTFATIMK